MIFCATPPAHAFSLLGLSPLYVCRRHLASCRAAFAYYARDVVVGTVQS